MSVIPTQIDLAWPVIKALRQLGGSGSIEEIDTSVAEIEGFDEDTQAVLHGTGPRTELQYRLAWARTYLKNQNLVVNSRRGVWAITEQGNSVSEDETLALIASWRRTQPPAQSDDSDDNSTSAYPHDQAALNISFSERDRTEIAPDEPKWKIELLHQLLSLDPFEFEHLTRRLLREEGFIQTEVTRRSRDGGIDGVGTFRISLISFRVFFQCKRYAGSVRASEVRDFRGAMQGRGDKGLLITTGSFTNDAKYEASREGAIPIELIDGDRLCDLLRERELGVITEEKTIQTVRVDREFFESNF